MDCIIAESIRLGGQGYCPYAATRCDGKLHLEWLREYALIPEEKTCISRGKENRFIEVSKADLEAVASGSGVLMIRTQTGGVCFVKVQEEA